MRPGFHQFDPRDKPDGSYVVEVASGVVGLTDIPPSPTYVPLTTTVNGVPDLVWDNNDELVLTEVTL